MKTLCLEKVVKEIFGEQDMLVLHLVVLEMGFADRELHPLEGSGGVPGIEIIQLYKDDVMMEIGTKGAQNCSTLEAINGYCLMRIHRVMIRSALWWWWLNHGEHKIRVDADNWSFVVEANFGMQRSGKNVVKLKALKLEVEGSDAENVCYLRHLNDANRLATVIQSSSNGKTVVIGGGYIGMECAASLVINKNQCDYVFFPEARCMERLFTPKIASLYEDYYRAKEVKFIKGTVLTSFEFDSNKKSEVLGFRNTKHTNNLHGRVSEDSHVKGSLHAQQQVVFRFSTSASSSAARLHTTGFSTCAAASGLPVLYIGKLFSSSVAYNRV
ncbi:hypothetical protein DY000_02050203 [Brassica cretica]|uniref:FAD/NAD(P)-binding domain-containing protein n=1 Tax=Brassica cretica TaxID=69181 RepID=A0ABQ7EXX1_BRACR|nr:hypothetical protein DY000_02050203 [Brassica cretica]